MKPPYPGSPNAASAAEVFFREKLNVVYVDQKEYVRRMQARDPAQPEEKILESNGANFDQDGKTVILIRTDVYPEEYLPYVETHEKWEAYVARKDGYNLYAKAKREYMHDHEIEEFTEERKAEFFATLRDMRYEFRHEYAVYKEYEQAYREGRLAAWHEYVKKVDTEMLERASANEIPPSIRNDWEIRDSIFKKISEGTAHSFSRD